VRQLDNLININELPIPEAVKSDKENRAIGLGVMGFSDTIEQLGIPYDSTHAYDFADEIFEFVSFMAIDESANLAKERGSYKHFKGSGWSKGKVPIDTIETLENNLTAAASNERNLSEKLAAKEQYLAQQEKKYEQLQDAYEQIRIQKDGERQVYNRLYAQGA